MVNLKRQQERYEFFLITKSEHVDVASEVSLHLLLVSSWFFGAPLPSLTR